MTLAAILIWGKTSSGYEEAYRIELPPGEAPYQIRMTKHTQDTVNTQKVGNDLFFSSYTEIISANMMYMDSGPRRA
jgi:predicted phage tail protein